MLAFIAAGLAALWYALLISGAIVPPPSGEEPVLVFNAMLTSMLAGRFDVPAAAIGMEGFVHGGRVIAYFGIFPALLRLPLLAIPAGLELDVTRASIVLGAAVAAYWQMRAVRLLVAQGALPPVLAALLASALLLGGPQVQFLRATMYEEVLHWSSAWSAMFVAVAFAGVVEGFTEGRMRLLALSAGLAFLTRASTGAGLLVALAALMQVQAWRGEKLRHLRMPVAIAGALVCTTLAVNFARWGNPFTVVDLSSHLMNARYPGRMARIALGGEFSIIRLPFGMMYYFAPIWPLYLPGGGLIFQAFQDKLVEAEMPPASLLLSDPLLLLLAGRLRTRAAPVLAVAAGLALPALLMLGLVFMNHRYRHEFYPLLTFAAFVATWQRPTGLPRPSRLALLAGVGVGFAHVFLFLYLRSGMGPSGVDTVQALLRRLGL